MSGQPEKLSPSASEPKPIGIIEAEWRTYMSAVVPVTAGIEQRRSTRAAFFAGAASLYSSLMTGLDAGSEETQADIDLMASIRNELDTFQP